MHEGTTDFLKTFIILFAIGLFLWWLRNDFGSTYALGAVIVAVILLFGTVLFVLGGVHSHKIQKDTMDGISKFNAQDATIDRYRMQSLREISKGQSWQLKADAQKQIIDYKAEKKLLSTNQSKPDENETFWSNNETVDLDEWS